MTLTLWGALAIGLMWQGANIRALRRELADSSRETAGLMERLDQAEVELEEAQTKTPMPSICFENAVVNPADRTLTVDIRAELPGCTEYSTGFSLGCVGEPYDLGWDFADLSRQDDGSYVDTVTFPLDLDAGMELRLEDDTVLYSSETMTPLLPLQLAYGGTVCHHNSELRLFYQCDGYVKLENLQGEDASVTDGAFRVYRNGKLVFEGQDHPENRDEPGDGPYLEGVGLPCEQGDHMRTSYVCTDAFGLQYEFPLCEWIMMKWDGVLRCPLSHRPTITWPE